MTVFTALPFVAGISSILLAIASVLRKKPTPATWCFGAGMGLLGLDSLCTGFSVSAANLADALAWLTTGLIIKSLVPAVWLGFSLTYSRGNATVVLARWRNWLVVAAVLPISIGLIFRSSLVEVLPAVPQADVPALRLGAAAKALNVVLLVGFALVLMNLEQTFRAAVGTMRWRIKYVVLGLAVIFGGHLYVRSQAILFSALDISIYSVESSALFIGCLFLVLAYARAGLAEADVYPSRAVLRSSLTILVVGAYLFLVGVLAQVAAFFGGVESFRFQAFVILLGMAGLALLLLSDRFRQRVHAFVVRHFGKAQHDSVQVWAGFSRRVASVKNATDLCGSTAQFVSETFGALSVAVWLLNREDGQFVRSGSTTRRPGEPHAAELAAATAEAVDEELRSRDAPFNLEAIDGAWAEELRRLNPTTFDARGGNRWCVPLVSGDRAFGAVVLADRVGGAAYSTEEIDLLSCIAAQVTSVLLNLRLADEVAHAKELETFRTMSAFFVHDLKNTAASLNLMLKNLPVHFDNPEFRADALRSIGNTARRIDEMICRLGALRQGQVLETAEADLNQLVSETVEGIEDVRALSLTMDLQPLPRVAVDRQQIRSVIANLLLNSRDAIGPDGRIAVRTWSAGGRVTLSIGDNGCGMNDAFMRESLFRPFQSTKKNGLGIGMFQARIIVEGHGGTIAVQSAPGQGTTVRVNLPARMKA
jgi:putative PEP-CTERM system histidine kinase